MGTEPDILFCGKTKDFTQKQFQEVFDLLHEEAAVDGELFGMPSRMPDGTENPRVTILLEALNIAASNKKPPALTIEEFRRDLTDRIKEFKERHGLTPERTLFADNAGRELFLGNVVRVKTKEPFNELHGDWVDYEIGKGAGGYVLLYVRSATGVKLPFGYTGTFMFEFDMDDGPDLKQAVFTNEPIRHPSLTKIEDDHTPEERRDAWDKEMKARREERHKST